MAILKVTAVPEFGALESAIRSLQNRQITIPFDTSSVQNATQAMRTAGNAASDLATKITSVANSTGEDVRRTLEYIDAHRGLKTTITQTKNEEHEWQNTQMKTVQNLGQLARNAREAEAALLRLQKAERQQEFQTADARLQAYFARNQLMAGSSFAFDANGHLVKTGSGQELPYAAFSQMSQPQALASTDDSYVRMQGDFRAAMAERQQAYKEEQESIKGVRKEMKGVGDETKGATKESYLLGDSLGRIVLKMAAWQLLGNAIASVRRAFSEALETMKAVDDELVTVRKVTGATSEELARIEDQAYKTATAYGVAADAYLESVAAFARAGYKEQSADLAELSTKAQIVGDMTAETANQFLLSVDAAYKFKGEIKDLNRVLDGANEIDNKYATSIEKISEGLGIVAPVAAQVHVGINELTAALGTITAVTQRSGSEAARALRAIFLNIVGDTKTEIDEGVTWTTGEIAGLQDVIKMYAKDAYDAAQATGSVINPMEAIAGLAKSMKEGVLSEQELINMVSDIGGKLRTSQLLAIIQNWDMYESMLEDYKNAYGSADKEVENALDSWTRKTEQVKNAWTELVNNIVDTSLVKGALDLIYEGLSKINDAIDQGNSFSAWNMRYGYGNGYRDDAGTGAFVTSDVRGLRDMKAAIEEAKAAFEESGDLDAYIESLQEVENQWGEIAGTLRVFMSENEPVSAAQKEMVRVDDELAQTISDLTDQQYRLAHADEIAAQEAADYAVKLLEENVAAQDTIESLYKVTAETITFNNTNLDVNQKVAALRALAEQAGVAAAYISGVMNTGALANWVDSEMNAGHTQEEALNSYFRMVTRHISSTASTNPNAYGYTHYNPTTQKPSTSTTKTSSASSGKSEAEKAQAERLKKLKEAATQAKKDAKEARDAEIKEIQDQIDALKERNEAEKDALELEKKKEEVLKKQNELLAAQAERTVRMYNKQTGQWEWVADASKVKKAEDALKTAQESLAEYKRNKAIEDEIAELEKRKNAIKEYYDEVESRIDKTLDGLENSTTDLTDAFRELGIAVGEQQQAVEEETEEAQGGGAGAASSGLKPIDGTYTVDPATGKYLFNSFRRKDDTPDKVVKNGREYAAEDFPDLFDLGGILRGMGGIKATRRDEIVIPPSIAEKMLSPVADQAFAQRMSELNFIYGNGRAPDAIMRSGGAGSVVNNSGTTYNFGGVTLTEQQAKTTSVYELAQLAQGLRCYS